MNFFNAVIAILVGLVPPSVWKFSRGARLQPRTSVDRRGIDRDQFVYESWLSAVAVCFIAFALLSFGFLPIFGSGFLLAAEADKRRAAMVTAVDSKIAELQKEQKAQGTKIDTATRLLTDSLASAKAGQIRLAISKRCKTTGFVERDEQLREIERLQGEYVDLKGYKYDAPSCGEL